MPETIEQTIERFARDAAGGTGPISVKVGRGLWSEMRRRGLIVDRPFPNPAFPDDPWILPAYEKGDQVFAYPDPGAPDWDYVMGDGGTTARW